MIKKIILLFIISCSCVLAQSGVKVGDDAPPLSVDEWLKGEPVKSFEEGKVYLVEFWGTWCTPCIENIPHLSKIQNDYSLKGLVVIGVATHEFDGREKLDNFMKRRGSEMEYRVAYDSDFSMEKDWDTGVTGSLNFRLPICFVVGKKGIVEFVGHPADSNLEYKIEKALDE